MATRVTDGARREEKERLLAVYSSPERSMPAYGQNCTVQDNKGGGGGFSLLRLTAIKQRWIDVLTL